MTLLPRIAHLPRSLGALVALALGLAASAAGCSDSTLIRYDGEIKVDPEAVVFDRVTLGTVETQDVKIINIGNGNLEVTALALKVGMDSLNIAGEPKVLGPDEQMIVHVTYSPLVTDEVLDALLVTNDATEHPVEVPITATGAGEVVPDIYADPEEAEFGEVPAGEERTLTIEVGNDGFADLQIHEVELIADPEFQLLDHGGLPGSTLPSAADGGTPGTITLTYYQPSHIEANSGVLYVRSNDPDEPELEIPVSAESTVPGGDGPIAVCSVDPEEASSFDTLHWYGDESYDTNGYSIVSYVWTVVEFPPGSDASLTGSGANRTTVSDLAGDYTAQLVVTNELGQSSWPCQATANIIPSENLWVEMYWTHSGDDMDLHLLKPGGAVTTNGDCYYANCVGFGLEWGDPGPDDNPHLDLDDIPGTGPENINIENPYDGVYTVVVHDYPGSVYNGTNETFVNIYVAGSLVASFSSPMSTGENHYWYVAEVEWPTGDVTPL